MVLEKNLDYQVPKYIMVSGFSNLKAKKKCALLRNGLSHLA